MTAHCLMPGRFSGKTGGHLRAIPVLGVVLLLVAALGWQTVPPARLRLERPDFGYWANVADLKNAPLLSHMGFRWTKGFVGWDSLEPRPGRFDWTDLSKAIAAARRNGLGHA